MPLDASRLAGQLSDQDVIDALLGVEPPSIEQPGPDEQPLPPASFLERLGASGSVPEIAPPRGILEGILAGAVQGISSRANASAARRSKAEEAIAARRAEREKRNQAATEEFRKARLSAAGEIAKETRAEERESRKYERERPEREAARAASERREQRAADLAERQAQAAERQERLARVSTTNQLATAYRQDKAIESYYDVRSNLNTAETAASLNSGPGDIAIIFSFMRAIEPGNVNVVREGDVKTAESAVSLLQRASIIPKKYVKGEKLTPEGREYFLDFMRRALESRRPDFDQAQKQFIDRAVEGGIDPGLVIREPIQSPRRPSSVGASAPGQYQPGGFFDSNRPGGP